MISPEELQGTANAPSSQALLTVNDLVVEFPTRHGPLTAVDGVSFDVASGEILGVVGESGAGKSLTGAAIIGLLDPPGRIAGGSIHLHDQRIDQLSAEQMRTLRGKSIGVVFQDPMTSLNPLYTIAEQLIETIRTHMSLAESAARERAIGLLDDVGIPAAAKRIDDYPHQFSGGMRQRVVIALALAAEPDLVIADEPTTALDVSVQAQIIDVLKEQCSERGASVILITHDMGVIAEAANRVAVMYAGRLVEIGPVKEIIQQPRHPYTQGLMGSIPSLSHASDRLVQIPGNMPSISERPAGCAFHPRCSQVLERCAAQQPIMAGGDQRRIACWLYDDAELSRNDGRPV
ncbi:MAG: ABC transporter ATP-binding protein [Granulosicoccus sp.]|nr:ABC transporter ATP-binding protein [Granulosicoccus sp.]